MENTNTMQDNDFKFEYEIELPLCRCCLSSKTRMRSVSLYRQQLHDLAGLNVSDSDGLPQWMCLECCALLLKATRFKKKVLRANTVLYEYLSRCAPFPIDSQDPELAKYASPCTCITNTLVFDSNGKGKLGFHRVLEHEKQPVKSDLEQVSLPPTPAVYNDADHDYVKEEAGFSEYEDNITLEDYKSNVSKLEEVGKITEDDLAELLEVSEKMNTVDRDKRDKRKKKTKKKDDKVKRRKISDDVKTSGVDVEEPRSSIRKAVELDPTKIRVVTLNPEEQVKQREEESKMTLKFPFHCHLCYKGFNFEAKLQNHMAKHSPSRGQFECKLCSMFLPTAYSHGVHSLIHTRRYECLRCHRRMIDRNSILEHYRTQHEGFQAIFTCHVCGKVSNNSKTHRGHMRNHHSGARPKCDQCGKTFVNKDSLAEHIQIHQGIKNYECSLCSKRFRTRTQMKHHQLKHSDVKLYYCVECDVRFKSSHSLRQHLQKSLKHKDKHSLKFSCPRCDKCFDRVTSLEQHVRVQHEGVRAHRCPHCPAALATRASLGKHVGSVHRGERPPPRHVCDTCGKAFRGKSVLTNHVRTHTGEKPFECAHCGRKFTQRTAMRTHVKLVHLKIRRTAKIKPEMPLEARDEPKMDMFPKQESPFVFDSWGRQLPSTDVYFQVTAGS